MINKIKNLLNYNKCDIKGCKCKIDIRGYAPILQKEVKLCEKHRGKLEHIFLKE